MSWRLAKSLDVLRTQINDFAPNRSKKSDGTIGNAAHAARTSDHNPNDRGIVCALDVTHDPQGGCDGAVIAELLRASRDRRIKYVIFNGRIFSSALKPWQWRPYVGSNRHEKHVHISVYGDDRADDPSPWAVHPQTNNVECAGVK